MQFLATLIVCLAPVADAEPTTRPSGDSWEKKATLAWPGFGAADLGFAEKMVPQHLERLEEYRKLEMTPVTGGEAFREKLGEAIVREALFFPDVPAVGEEILEPAKSVEAEAPAGPMTPEMFDSLTVAVRDALLVITDRPFADQRAGYFNGRVPEFRSPKIEAPVIEMKLGEEVDAATLADYSDDEIWKVLERMYEARRTAFDGGFNVTGAALDGPRGIACQIFKLVPGTSGDGILLANGNPNGNGFDNYWRADLIVCARQLTHPPISSEEVLARDGYILRADVQTVLEMKNGERAPMVMTLNYEPEAGRWWVNTCCFTSSPFVAIVGQTR